ncbi:MAG: family 20 glycosylhydrolase [Bacteroides sp.]|nr:family 20 glycosylhydrolase [Bacteroides sp.]
MRKKLALLLLAAAACCTTVKADLGNLIPAPAQMTAGTGELVLPAGFNVTTTGLSDEMKTEVTNFVTAINKATGLGATASDAAGLFTVSVDQTLPAEGYTLEVTPSAVNIAASTPAGLFYAFQTVKKILPVNVMAGVEGEAGVEYALPAVTIADQPRFEYRGYMLDVSRHFFDVNQIKKMLDVMAIYKLNKFHWHLTDDQGWRMPMEKYPLLTTQGATNHNILHTNFETQERWRDDNANATYDCGETYGPYSYTLDEMKEIVDYAKARHIEVIPEIDMPGHMVAAINCYPNFSTDPESKIALNAGYTLNSQPIPGQQDSHFTHNMWNDGGVSKDVLDISKPEVITFCKDVIDVLADIFPSTNIHIGGDECPTYAWSKSDAVQQFKTETLGYPASTSDHVLQTWFTKQIADYAKEQYGKKIMGWNELITSGGADMDLIKEMDPTIFCWIGGEQKAQNNGLKFVYTPFNGGYYINRSYAGFDQIGAVGDGRLSTTLSVMPPVLENCIGVQGTFWTEQVERPTDVEYLALPRLLGIAEQGWAPAEGRDNDEVMERICNDAALLDAAGYNYGAHQLVRPSSFMKPDPMKWYRISTICSDERADRVWEVVLEGSPLIEEKSAQVGKLWSNVADDQNDAQLFRFVEDPNNKDHYAIICKAIPGGSLSPEPSGTTVGDRWSYNNNGLSYGFELSKDHYFETEDGTFRYAIRPYGQNGKWLNFSKNGQKLAINVYNNPLDGNGGVNHFTAVADVDAADVPAQIPEEGKYYRLITRFNGDQNQERYGSCIELLGENHGKGNNAQYHRLWSNTLAQPEDANYDNQFFTFVPDPTGSGYYALVCKAQPGGSVNCVPSVANNSNTARWDYDDTVRHFGFYLVDTYNGNSVQGTDEQGFYSALTSKDAADGWYINTSAAGQGFSIHLYNNPTDQNAGIYTFEPHPENPNQGGQVSIDAVNSSSNFSAHTYDLQGRRVNNPVSGLYIQNGKLTRL